MAAIMHNVWYHAHYVLTEKLTVILSFFFFFLKSNIESLTVVCIIFFQRHNFPLTFHSASVRYFSLQKLPIKKQTKQTKASFEPLF